LGSYIVETAPKKRRLILAYHTVRPKNSFESVKIDLSDRIDIERKLRKIKPQVIIHAARIDPYDNDEKMAKKYAEHLARLAKEIGSRLIYISSDAVFDGRKGNYKESNKPNPVTPYGRAKLAAELAIKKILKKNYIIIRPSYIHSIDPKRSDKRTAALLENVKTNDKIFKPANMYRSPVPVAELARAVWKLLDTDFCGTIHVAGKKQSIYQFCKRIMKQQGLNPKIIRPTKIIPGKKDIAPDTSLNSSFARRILVNV